MNLQNLVVLMVLLFSTLMHAHDRRTITGRVTDGSGATVPSAKLTLTNPATGQTITVDTGSEGTYRFLSLAAGRYQIVPEKAGFRKAEATDVVVQVNTATRLNTQMQLGLVQESIQVEATAPLLQSDRSDLGTVVDNRAIQQLPLFINGGLRSNVANRHLLGSLNTAINNSNFGTFSNPPSSLPQNLQFSVRASS